MKQKVYVIHENLEWTQHLVKWLEELEVPYELWDLSSGILDLQSPPPQGIFYNRMSASSHTRGHRYAPEFTEQVITWLEAHGRKVVNGTGAINLEISKVKQYLKLNESGIETPATVAVLGQENIIEAARKLNIYPLITKHNRAGKGLGVQLFQNEEELEAYVNSPLFEPQWTGLPCYKPTSNQVMDVSVVQSLSIRSFSILFQSILQMVSNFVQQMVVKSVRGQNNWKLLKNSKLQNLYQILKRSL